MKQQLKTKSYMVLNVDPEDPSNVKILASNKIDAGKMTKKFFEFHNKAFAKAGGAQGNLLLLFDGKKQQIIKLDASVGITRAVKQSVKDAAASPPEKETAKAPKKAEK